MGLGGLIGRAFREGIEAAKRFPELLKVKGKSGGDLDIGDILPSRKNVGSKFDTKDRSKFGERLSKKFDDDPGQPKNTAEDLVDLVERLGGFQSGGRVGLREGGISDLMDQALGGDATSNYVKLQLLDALTNFAGSDAIFNAIGPLIGFQDGGRVGIMSTLK
jgi:hypothetical protein